MTVEDLESLLKGPEYRGLFKGVIAAYGGWTELIRTMTLREFDRLSAERRDQSEVVCSMIDYRFRYLDHGGSRKDEANISRGEFYRWRAEPPVSHRTIRSKWSQFKPSAVFLYVSETHNFEFFPRDLAKKNFTERLRSEAADFEHIRQFLGTCAYVMEKFDFAGSPCPTWRIPRFVKRVRPTTERLSEETLATMASYKDHANEMRRG